MGNLASRQGAREEETDTHSSSAYRYPPKSGNYFGSHFIMGGEKFDSPQPESFLFGDNSDLNFLGCKPVPFPYPPPQANEPTKTLRSLVNIRRDSLHFVRVKPDPCLGDEGADQGPYEYNIQFTFDCDVRIAIRVSFLSQEESQGGVLNVVARDPSTSSPWYQYRKGASQVFTQPTLTTTPYTLEPDVLAFSEQPNLIPVAIQAVAEEGEEPRQAHLTLGIVERHPDGNYVLKALKQKLYVDGLCYLLQEIYGIENKGADVTYPGYDPSEDEVEDTGAECVVCMSDMRDTLILPCRHLCLCNTCADSLRYQANNCPICRAPFRALLQVRPLQKSGHSATHPALAAEAHTEGVPPGFELVSLVEALNGPVTAPPPPILTLTSEITESEAKSKKKAKRRGSREQREKERAEARRVSAASSVPPVEEPLPPPPSPPNSRKESITIEMEKGVREDLVEEELAMNETEGEIEATTEDELLKDCKAEEEDENEEDIERLREEVGGSDEEEEEDDEEEDEEDEEDVSGTDDPEIVSLRGLRHSQSLPATPRSQNSPSTRVSQDSEESTGSSNLLLASSNSTKVIKIGKSSVSPHSEPSLV